jgi:putative redox protein
MSSSEVSPGSAAGAPAAAAGPPAKPGEKPAIKTVTLTWSGEGLRFEGGPENRPPVVIDSGGDAGASPMDHLLLALAGCMSADVIDILRKGRVPVERYRVEVIGQRAPTPPRRYTAIAMIFHISGPTSADRPKVERAVNLSRETYCSVTHTLRPDLDLTTEIRLD